MSKYAYIIAGTIIADCCLAMPVETDLLNGAAHCIHPNQDGKIVQIQRLCKNTSFMKQKIGVKSIRPPLSMN